jgi:hypothetical protein
MGWKFPEMPEPGQGERMVVVGGLVPHATPEDVSRRGAGACRSLASS